MAVRKINNGKSNSTPRELNNVRRSDTALYGIEKRAENSYNKLNDYITRRTNNEYMTADELADYRNAITNYGDSFNKLSDIGGSNEYNADIEKWLEELGADITNNEQVMSQYKDAESYNAAVKDYTYRNKYQGKSYTQLQKDIAALKNEIPDAGYNTFADKGLMRKDTSNKGDEIAWLENYAVTDKDVIGSMTEGELQQFKNERNAKVTKLDEELQKLDYRIAGYRSMMDYESANKTAEEKDELQSKRDRISGEIDVVNYWRDQIEKEEKRKAENAALNKINEYYETLDYFGSELTYKKLEIPQNTGSLTNEELSALSGMVQYAIDYNEKKNKWAVHPDADNIAEELNKPIQEYFDIEFNAASFDPDVFGITRADLNELEPGERSKLIYLFNTDAEKAVEYIKALKPFLRSRAEGTYDENVRKLTTDLGTVGTILGTASTVSMAPIVGIEGLGNLVKGATGQEIHTGYSDMQRRNREIISEDFSDIGKAAYSVITNIGDVVVNSLVAKGLLSGASLLSSGTSGLSSAISATNTASNLSNFQKAQQFVKETNQISRILMAGSTVTPTMQNAIDRGLTNEQVVGLGLSAFLAEYITESIGIESFLSNPASALGYLVKNAGAEGLEELLAGGINTIADKIIAGGDSEINLRIRELMATQGLTEKEAFSKALTEWALNLGYEGLLGFISGGVFGLGGTFAQISNTRVTKQVTKALGTSYKGNKASYDSLIDTATVLAKENTEVAKALKAVEKKDSKFNIGTLSREVIAAVNKEFSSAETVAELDTLKGKYGSGNIVVNAYNTNYKRITGYTVNEMAKPEAESYTKQGGEISYKGITKEGTEVEVKGIDIVTGEIVTDKGNFAPEDIALNDNAAAMLVEKATEYDNHDVADLYIAAYDPQRQSVGIYNNAFDGIYTAATLGQSFDEVWNTYKDYNAFDEIAARNIWKAGNAKYIADQSRRDTKLGGNTTVAETPTKKAKSKGEVRFRNGVKAETSEQKNAVKLAQQIAKIIGIDIEFFDSRVDKNVNGWFNRKTDTIHLDMQKAVDDRHTIAFTLSHELVHFIEKWSPAKYDVFAQFLLEKYAEKGMDLNAMLIRKQNELEANNGGKRVSVDEAYSELIADSCEAFLLDSNATEVLSELASQDKDLVAKIKRFFADILNKLRKAYKNLSPQSLEGQMMRKIAAECEQIYRMFEQALSDATQNYRQADTVEMEALIEETPNLIAVHNITGEQLINALKKGGIAGPSVAVVKKAIAKFGEISLGFDKSSIDPSVNANNKLYGSDAWTPGQTTLKKNAVFNKAKTEAAINKVHNILGEHTELFDTTAEQIQNDMAKAKGDLHAAFDNNIGLQTAYALQEGIIDSIPENNDGSVNMAQLEEELKALSSGTGVVWGQYRRSFVEPLIDSAIESYETATVDETVEVMREKPDTAKGFKLTSDGTLTVPAARYKSIDALKANENKLSDNAEEAAADVGNKFVEFAEGISKKENTTTDKVVAAINKGFDSRYRAESIIGAFKENGINLNKTDAQALMNLYKEAVNLPSEYFEAKAMRNLTFDEVRVAVVPNSFAENHSDVIQGLRDYGIEVRTYEDGNNQQRVDILNSFDDLRFQRRVQPTDSMVQYNRKAVDKHKVDLEKYYTKSAAVDLGTLNERYDELLKIWDEIGGELNSEFLEAWNNKGQDHAFTVFKAQAGYKYNIELSSMCKKGVPLFEAIDRIVKSEVMSKLKSDTIGKAEKEILYDILKQHHFEIPCAICYVEQARQREGTIINAFLNGNEDGKLGWNQVLSDVETRMKEMGVDYTFATVSRDISTDKYSAADLSMDEKTQNAFYKAIMSLCNEEIDRYNKETKDNKLKRKIRAKLEGTTPADVKKSLSGTLPANLTLFKVLFNEPSSRFAIDRDLLYSSMTTLNLAKRHKALYSLFNSQGGTAGYKTKQTPIVYVGDMLKKKWAASTAREAGGIRNQSNSDFQMYTLLDQAQMYMDFTAKGQYLQAYTKVLAELKLFGLSRGKINASLIPAVHVYKDANGAIDVQRTMENAGLDENGEPIFDDIEGIPHEEAFMLIADENYSKSIGGICIGYSYKHIDKLLDDPRVQLVIGFHDKTNDPDKRYRGAKYAHNFNGENEAKGVDDKGKYGTIHIGFNQFVIRAEKMFKSGKNDTFTGTATFNGKQYSPNDIPKLAADLYLDHCEQNNYTPAYERFSTHENYYKLLADFSLYDSKGNYAPHRKVAYEMPTQVPYLDKNGAKKYMDTKAYIKAELEGEMAIRDDLSVALADESADGIIPQFIKKANELYDEMNDVQYQGKNVGQVRPISIPGSNRSFTQKFVDDILDSFGITNIGDYSQVQENVFDTLNKESFFTNVESRSRIDVNEKSGMAVETNKSGLDETFCMENYGRSSRFKKIVKLATIRKLPEAIKNGDLIADNVKNTHGNNRGTKYAYILYDTEIDGVELTIKLAIRKSKQKNKFWVHNVETIKNVSDSPADTNEGVKTGLTTADTMDIVTQPDDSVNTEDNQFQQKLPSDRKILADALESVSTTNEKDADIIRRYKAQMDTITKAETRLAEVNAEIKELSFAKGKRDTARLNALHNEKTALTKKVNDFDKRLLRMESTEVLKNLLDREKAKVRAAANAKAKEKLNEVRQKERDRAAQREADLKAKASDKLSAAKDRAAQREAAIREKFREAQEKGRENRAKTELRSKIKKFKEKLEKTMLNPTERNYVPAGLFGAMVDVCELIDTDTDLYKADGSINKAQEKRNLTHEKLLALEDEYAKLTNESDAISEEYDPVIAEYLKDIRQKYTNKSLNDMTLGELDDLYNNLVSIQEVLTDARKLIGLTDAADIYEAADSIAEEQKAIQKRRKKGERGAVQKARDFVAIKSLSPMRAVERMSDYNQDSYLVKLFKKLEAGVRDKNFFIMNAYKSFEAVTKGENADNYEKALYNPYGNAMTDHNGKTFYITKMQAMQALMSYEREVANKKTKHVEIDGFSFADLNKIKEGKMGESISDENIHQINGIKALELVERIKESLKNDKWAQAYMNASREFFDNMAKNAVNETMLKLKRRIVARELKYIPFEVDRAYIVKEISGEFDIQQTINGYGMLKETQQNAAQPLVITGLNNIIDRHIEQVGNVVGLAIPIRDFNKVWNTRSNGTPINRIIGETWGDPKDNGKVRSGKDLIVQTIKDLQSKRNNGTDGLLEWIKSNYIEATFFMNFSVISKQVASMYAARSMIEHRSSARMLGNLAYTIANYKKLSAEVDKYTATVWLRRQGVSDAELETLLTQKQKGIVGKFVSKIPVVNKFPKLIAAMDSAVALSLWKYCKADVKKATGLTGEELNQATAKYFDEVVENTQSMADVLHRPEIQKQGGIAGESFGMFKTDLYQQAGQLQTALGRYMKNKNKANAKALGKAAWSCLSSSVWTVLVTSVVAVLRYKVDPYRDDEDEEFTLESWLKQSGYNLLGDLGGYVMPLGGGELASLVNRVRGKSDDELFNSLALDVIEDGITAVTKLADIVGEFFTEGELPSFGDVDEVLSSLLQMFGVPYNNASRAVKAFTNHLTDIKNGEFLEFIVGKKSASGGVINKFINLIDDGDTKEAKSYLAEALADEAERKAGEDGYTGDSDYYLKKYEDEAKSTLRKAISKELKPLYIEALQEKDKSATKRIRNIMAASQLYDNIEDTFIEWRKDEVSGDFKDRYLDAYARKDYKAMEKVIKEMAATGLWKKPMSAVQTWIRNYNEGA